MAAADRARALRPPKALSPTRSLALRAWLSLIAILIAAPVQAGGLLEVPPEGEHELPPPDQVDGPALVGDDPAEAADPTVDPQGDAPPAPEVGAPPQLTPLPATLGGMAGAAFGVGAGMVAMLGLGGGAILIAALFPAAIPVVLGAGVAALIAATLIPAMAGTGAGIGAMLTQGEFDLMSVLSVLVFTAAIYITIAVVIIVLVALAALVALFFAALVGGGGSLGGCGGGGCNGCGNGCNGCCTTAGTTSSVHGGPVCAEAAMLPPYAAVKLLFGKDPSPLAIYPTLGGMVGSFAGGVGGAAAVGLTSWAIAGSVLPANDPNIPIIVTAAAGGGFLLGTAAGAVIGGGVASLAATVPTPELEEIRGKRTDDGEYYYYED